MVAITSTDPEYTIVGEVGVVFLNGSGHLNCCNLDNVAHDGDISKVCNMFEATDNWLSDFTSWKKQDLSW